tara:strand:- start:7 stop:2007 length:2001 start_codon:yes stop_codon:yes gene_type:complete
MLSSKGQFDAMQKMAFAPQDSLPADLVEGYFDRQNKKSPLGFLKNLIGKEQGGMVQYEEGGELGIRRSPMPIQSPKMLGEDSINSILSIINQGKRNGVNVADTPEYKRYNKSYNLLTKNTKKGVPPAEGEIDRVTNDYLVDISTKAYLMNELIKSGKYDSIGQIKDDFINLDLKDTMPKMEDGGEVHSRRMFNQGTGFDKKKSDLNKDGKISEYERKRGMAISKAMGKMQEGGMVADKTRVSQTYYPTESLNLPLANLASPVEVGSISQAPISNKDIAEIVMDIATPGAVIGSLGKKAVLRAVKKIPKRNSARQQAQLTKELSSMKPEEIDYNDLQFLQKKLRENADNLGSKNVQAINNIERELVKRGKTYPGYSKSEGPDLYDLKDSFDNFQMGGMVGMQRPMNPAMNFSPMQRMNPRMYQDGGQVQPRKQQEMRNPDMFIGPPMSLMGPGLSNFEKAEKKFEAFMDSLQRSQDINPFTGEPVDTDADVERLKRRMQQSKIPRSNQRMPMQEGGQVNVNSLMGKTVSAKDLGLKNLGEVTSFRPQFNMSQPEFEAILNYGNRSDGEEISQEEQMANFMSLLENEKRVRPVSPDKYIVKDGVMSEVEMNVPKLTSAYMSSFGIATPLSRRQGQMLQRKMIAPETLNPQVKGLLNRVLVQRLAAEEN